MDSDALSDLNKLLVQAYSTIEEQKQRIEALSTRLEDEREARLVRDVCTLVATTRTIAAPVTHKAMLEMIVRTASSVLRAESASLFLLDVEKQELIFEVAIGPKASEAKQHRVPLGQGIVSLVVLSGQPLAIADAGSSDLHASDIAQSIGYHTTSILAIPLFYGEQVIGALELLNKEGNETFNGQDIELGGLFAQQAAVAVELSRTHGYLSILFCDLLQTTSQGYREQFLQQTRSFFHKMEEGSVLRNALELAMLIQELMWCGEKERELCVEIIRSIIKYKQNDYSF